MSRMDQFDYLSILGKKVESVYKLEGRHGIQTLALYLGEEILTMSLRDGEHIFRLDLYTENEWIRTFDTDEISWYYPYSCFEGKIIGNVDLINQEAGKEVIELSFLSEDKKIRVSVEDANALSLDLDLIRPGFTINFANKSIEEVEALLLDIEVDSSDYVRMSGAVRAVYYYYSCIDNVFELASYIYEVFRKYTEQLPIGKPRAYELARKLIY